MRHPHPARIPVVSSLDRIDQKILTELIRNARLTNVELAKRVGLSASPCWNRVKSLEESGIIEGYSTRINRTALGLAETLFVEVTLEKHGADPIDSFIRKIELMPEVLEAYLVAGNCDFHLKVAASSTADFEYFLREKLHKVPGVRFIRSVLLLRTVVGD